MASFEQDLIVFEDDTLLVQYTFTDLQGTFSNSWGAYWAAWSYDDWTGARTGSNNASPPQPDLEKYTAWTVINADAANAGEGDEFLTAPSPANIEIPDGETIVKIYIRQADFLASGTGGPPPTNGNPWFLATDREYYTELVLSQTKNEGNSVVGATGKLFISSSIFSVANYRPN
jgi:hypothetical protein